LPSPPQEFLFAAVKTEQNPLQDAGHFNRQNQSREGKIGYFPSLNQGENLIGFRAYCQI